MIRFFLAALILFHSLWSVNTEEFLILPMGQGGGQLAIYKRETKNIGVLYDLGSKSLQTHPKFGLRGEWQKPFLASKKVPVMATNDEEDEIPFSLQTTPSRARATQEIQTPITTEKKLYDDQRETTKNELEEFIHSQLASLDHLFIFLSHSDEDHINFLNCENIPAHVPITVILAGDWFGDIGAAEGKTNFTKPAKEVLIFLSERIKDRIKTKTSTHFYFPFYAPDLNFQIFEMLQPQNLLERIKGLNISDAIAEFNNIAQPIIQQCLKIHPEAPTPAFLHGPFLEVFNHLLINPEFHDILRNVYIWSLNQPADDTNNHSMVVSCTLPSLNMSVVLTGDAENSVFHRISVENHGLNFRQSLANLSTFERIAAEKPGSDPQQLLESHLVMLMLPHHGAWKNRSGTMLRFFTPNVFGISAGDGRQHGHPSAELIHEIRTIYSRSFLGLSEAFHNRYEYKGKFHFITLANGHHLVDKAEDDKLVFLCPNVYGCIKWDHEGIRTNFNNSIKLDNGVKYSVLYAAHALETEKDISANAIGEQILGVSPDDRSIIGLTLMVPPAEFPYDYLAADEGGELFVGVGVVDPGEKKTTKPSRVYFYKLLASE